MGFAKNKITYFLLFILILNSVFSFSSCGKQKPSSEVSMKFLSEADFNAGDYEDKLKDSIEAGINEKSYVVMDFSLSNIKKVKKQKDGKILTAEIYIIASSSDKSDFKLEIEDFPTTNYSLIEENYYRAYIEMFDGIEDELHYRFIISLLKPVSGEITVSTGVEFWYNSEEETEGLGNESGARTTGKVIIDENIRHESKLDFMLSSDGSYYSVTGVGGEMGDKIKVPQTYLNIPVKEIASNAFLNVNSLKEIVLPESIEKIGASAFKGCTDVENFVIPTSVTAIGDDAFDDCLSAMIWCVESSKPSGWSDSFKDEETPVVWSSGQFFTKDSGKTTYTFTFYDDKFPFETLSIPETYLGGLVTMVKGNGAHDSVSKVKSLKIPSTVANIGEYAFHNCAQLTEIKFNASNCANLDSKKPSFSGAGKNSSGITVTFGAEVKNIPLGLFCVEENGSVSGLTAPNIKTVAIGKFVEKIGDYAFEGCTALTSASIAGGIIGNGVFKDCNSLSSVMLGDEVTNIGNTAFRNCTALESIVIGKGITSIGNYAFAGCTGLTGVRFADESTWYITKSSSDYSPSEATKMSVTDIAANAVAVADTYHDKHWFKK